MATEYMHSILFKSGEEPRINLNVCEQKEHILEIQNILSRFTVPYKIFVVVLYSYQCIIFKFFPEYPKLVDDVYEDIQPLTFYKRTDIGVYGLDEPECTFRKSLTTIMETVFSDHLEKKHEQKIQKE